MEIEKQIAATVPQSTLYSIRLTINTIDMSTPAHLIGIIRKPTIQISKNRKEASDTDVLVSPFYNALPVIS